MENTRQRAERGPGGGSPRRTVYRLRPSWIPRFEPDVFVPADLDLLRGPVSGVVDPPTNLYWQPGDIDFADLANLRRFYSSAIRRISDPDLFGEWINRRALVKLWPQLDIPATVRRAWETIHPELKSKENAVGAREQIQDAVLAVIADHGFALAGGSALLDYDVVTRDTEDIDAFLNRFDADAFNDAAAAVIDACERNGWRAELVFDQDVDKQVLVTAGGDSVVVQLVYHLRSSDPERRVGGGLRLVFDDVVGGKAVAAADSSRGRDFDDIAHIVNTQGWTLERVVEAMVRLGYPDKVDQFWEKIERFRRGEFDEKIREEGFDPAFAHRILDER
ncbi:hypothetical protein [Gordonia sihwensis]|uniref:hypothetical protein n=1 Tax=Gordonia sihwensis TaxID=173559 RepID=UPI003D9815DE